jgi:hypothetical protein
MIDPFVSVAGFDTLPVSVIFCYMVSPIPGLFLSSKEILRAKFSIVPGTWQLHIHSAQSACLKLLQNSDNCNFSINLSPYK